MDTCLMRTPHYYRQYAFSLGKESPHTFSKFNPLNTDGTLLINTDMLYSHLGVRIKQRLTVFRLPLIVPHCHLLVCRSTPWAE